MPRRFTTMVVALAAVLLACGNGAPAPPAASAPPPPPPPGRIVSLTATGTEMLFAIGAGDRVVAADRFSNFPEEAPTTDLSARDANAEAVAGYQPDLVVLNYDPGDLVAGLDRLGIRAVVLPAAVTLDDTYAQIEQLGALTGHIGDAAEVVARMRSDLADLAEDVPDRTEPLTYYHELDPSLYTATSKTFIGEIYALAGLENVADAADPEGTFGGYPQLNAEFLVEADPDLIFLADTKCCAQNAASVAARPGFASLRAVQDGRIVELDDDVASRWGPRVVELLATVVDATASVPAG